MQILIIEGKAVTFSWTDGCKQKRQESIVEQASKGPEELMRVCLWLENQGHHDLALGLLERYVA